MFSDVVFIEFVGLLGFVGRRRPKPHYKLEARDTDYGAGRLLEFIGLLGYIFITQ